MAHSSIYLYWETAGNSPVEFFIIERSNDAVNWQGIKTIAGNNGSVSPLQYFFADANLNSGDWYYRLKMVNASGTFDYSNTAKATIAETNTDIYMPEGPAEANKLFIGGITNIEDWDVSVLSSSASLTLKPAIINSNILTMPEMHSGIYLLKLQNRVDGQSKTIRFLKK